MEMEEVLQKLVENQSMPWSACGVTVSNDREDGRIAMEAISQTMVLGVKRKTQFEVQSLQPRYRRSGSFFFWVNLLKKRVASE